MTDAPTTDAPMTDATWTCRCGAVRMAVDAMPRGGTRIVCYCRDCRGQAEVLGADALLEPSGGAALYQTSPDRLRVVAGAERIGCHRLTRRGPYRWHAACCGTPMAISAPTRAVPFTSVWLAGLPDPDVAGPILARAFRDSATGPVPKPHGSMVAVLVRFAQRTVAARIRGAHRASPFFAADGTPLAAPTRPDRR